jgi:hypothetical protein
LHLSAAIAALGNDLTVDRRSIRLDESISIVVTLDDSFATVDSVNVPVKNLTIEGAPGVSSEFSWINGRVVRRKLFHFRARALEAGAALVGPLVIVSEDGEKETLAPVSLQVVPDAAAGTNDPEAILRELQATNRDPFFIAAEIDKSSVYAGEEVVITWYLYNAATVQRWQIVRVPKLEDFWSEEIDVRGEPATQTIVGNIPMEKAPLRRLAVFPLRSGSLSIGSMEVAAAILRRSNESPFFGMFEGSLVEVRFPSARIAIESRPLPKGETADVVGDVTLECGAPVQRNGGPVTFNVALSGRANLRTAAAPRFDGAITGASEVQERSVTVDRVRDGVLMTRKWSYIVFPAASGTLRIPQLKSSVFNPRTASMEELRCGGASLEVSASNAPEKPNTAPAPLHEDAPRNNTVPLVAAIGSLIVVIAAARARRAMKLRREVREIVSDRAHVRDSIHAMLAARNIAAAAIEKESSDRGDAYRALRSLLDALDRDRALDVDTDRELEARVRDLVQSLR